MLDFRSIPNLGPWYRADDIAIANAAQVTAWRDRSGNGLDLSKSASSTAVYDTAAANGRAAVSFSAPGVSTLTKSGVSYDLLTVNGEVDIWIVTKHASASNNNGTFGWGGDYIQAHLTYADVMYFDYYTAGSGRISVAQTAGWDDKWHVVNVRKGPEKCQWIWSDGVVRTTANKAQVIAGGSHPIYIGSIASGVSLTGYIAEVVWFKRALPPPAWQAVRDELYRYYRLPFQPMRTMRQEFARAVAAARFRRSISCTRIGARQVNT